jgi:hypothetical protein
VSAASVKLSSPGRVSARLASIGGTARRALLAAGQVAAAVLLALLALAGGVGWLYALYRAGVLGFGPSVRDALPLEALAGHAGQPLVRFLAAWLAAGAAAGLAMRATRAELRLALPAFATASALLIAAVGAVTDALTANQRVADHVVAQLGAPTNLAAWLALLVGMRAAAGRAGGPWRRA